MKPSWHYTPFLSLILWSIGISIGIHAEEIDNLLVKYRLETPVKRVNGDLVGIVIQASKSHVEITISYEGGKGNAKFSRSLPSGWEENLEAFPIFGSGNVEIRKSVRADDILITEEFIFYGEKQKIEFTVKAIDGHLSRETADLCRKMRNAIFESAGTNRDSTNAKETVEKEILKDNEFVRRLREINK